MTATNMYFELKHSLTLTQLAHKLNLRFHYEKVLCDWIRMSFLATNSSLKLQILLIRLALIDTGINDGDVA